MTLIYRESIKAIEKTRDIWVKHIESRFTFFNHKLKSYSTCVIELLCLGEEGERKQKHNHRRKIENHCGCGFPSLSSMGVLSM